MRDRNHDDGRDAERGGDRAREAEQRGERAIENHYLRQLDEPRDAVVAGRIAALADQLSRVTGPTSEAIREAFHLWRTKDPYDEEKNLAFAVLLKPVIERDVAAFSLRNSLEDSHHYDCLRSLVELDPSSVPEVVRMATDAARDDDAQIRARAGVLALNQAPATCQRISERLLVPAVAERLRDPEQLGFWARSVVDDRRRGTYPSFENGRPDGPVIDDLTQMQESYRRSVGEAAATLSADWWVSHELSADGGASRRSSSTFNICRLVCADILDDAAERKVGLLERARSLGDEAEARLRAALPKIRERLAEFAGNPELALSHLPRVDQTSHDPEARHA